jgi:hypothetical protein
LPRTLKECHQPRRIAWRNRSPKSWCISSIAEALSDIVKELKAGPSKWLKDQSPDYRSFEWQDGFGAFSLGMSPKAGAVD